MAQVQEKHPEQQWNHNWWFHQYNERMCTVLSVQQLLAAENLPVVFLPLTWLISILVFCFVLFCFWEYNCSHMDATSIKRSSPSNMP
jgi:hypothetical protein